MNGVPAGGALAGQYPNPTLAAGGVGTAALATGAVTADKLGSLPAVIVSNSIDQTFTSGTEAPATFDTTVYDPLGMHTSSSVITITRSGLYLVIGGVNWASNAAGNRIIQIAINGNVNNSAGEQFVPAVNGLPTADAVTQLTRLTAGDTLQMEVEQTSGGSLALRGITPIAPLLEAAWLGP